MLRGGWTRFTPIAWRSHRLKRKLQSSIAAEMLGIDEGLSAALYFRYMWTQIVQGISSAAETKQSARQTQLTIVRNAGLSVESVSSQAK